MAGQGELRGSLSRSALSPFQKGLWCSGSGCQLSLEPVPLGKPRSAPHPATPNLPLGFQSGTNSPQGHTAGQKNQSSCFPGHCGSRCRGRERKAGHRWCWRGDGVQGIGEGVWAGRCLHAGLGGMTTQWAVSGPQHLSGHLSEPLCGPLDWKPQQGGHSGTASSELPWGRGGHLSQVKKGSAGTSLPCSPLCLPGLPQPLRLHPPALSLLCFALSGSYLVFAFHWPEGSSLPVSLPFFQLSFLSLLLSPFPFFLPFPLCFYLSICLFPRHGHHACALMTQKPEVAPVCVLPSS